MIHVITTASCKYHPQARATATCENCFGQICGPCSRILPGSTVVCAGCRERVLARRRLFRAAGLVGSLLVLAGLVGLVTWQATDRARIQGSGPPPIAAAPVDDAQTARLRRAVDQEPCDRVQIVELADRLASIGNNREAVAAATRFFQKCGDHPRLRWVTYEANKRLGEWDAAIAEVNRLIEHNRYDRDYWVWRGLVHEEKGDFARAIADYRQSLNLEPRLGNVPFNLANLYERTGQPCEAIFPLEQFLHHYGDLPGAGNVRQRILGLYESGRCGDHAGRGRAMVSFAPGSPAITAIVTINSRHRGRFLVDTGASYVAVSPGFARAIGLEAGKGSVLVQTANGPVTATPTTLDAVAVQGARASRVNALIIDSLPGQIDGLLGLSFLARFEVTLNRQRGRLELSAPPLGH